MLKPLDPLLHSQLRLGIISLLISVEEVSFNFIKEKTGASSGNLSVQIDKLEKAGYIYVEKKFKGKKPLTNCKLSKKGLAAFELYVQNLKAYINPQIHKNQLK